MKTLLSTFLALPLLAISAFGADEVMIADFENNVAPKVNETSLKTEIVNDAEYVKEGKSALKLMINHDETAAGVISWKLPPGSEMATTDSTLSVWIHGSSPMATLQFSLSAADKGSFFVVKKIDWDGWQELKIPFSEFKWNPYANTPPEASHDFDPGQLKSMAIIVYDGISKEQGITTLYLDSIKLIP